MKLIQIIKSNRTIRFLVILTGLFLISFVFWGFNFKGRTCSFYYRIAGTERLAFETRSVPSVKGISKLNVYIEELLLGPVVQRGSPVFPLGTKVLFCFERKNELYLNISKDALLDFNLTNDLKKSYELLTFNVQKNFPSVKKINLFIDGNSVF